MALGTTRPVLLWEPLSLPPDWQKTDFVDWKAAIPGESAPFLGAVWWGDHQPYVSEAVITHMMIRFPPVVGALYVLRTKNMGEDGLLCVGVFDLAAGSAMVQLGLVMECTTDFMSAPELSLLLLLTRAGPYDLAGGGRTKVLNLSSNLLTFLISGKGCVLLPGTGVRPALHRRPFHRLRSGGKGGRQVVPPIFGSIYA